MTTQTREENGGERRGRKEEVELKKVAGIGGFLLVGGALIAAAIATQVLKMTDRRQEERGRRRKTVGVESPPLPLPPTQEQREEDLDNTTRSSKVNDLLAKVEAYPHFNEPQRDGGSSLTEDEENTGTKLNKNQEENQMSKQKHHRGSILVKEGEDGHLDHYSGGEEYWREGTKRSGRSLDMENSFIKEEGDYCFNHGGDGKKELEGRSKGSGGRFCIVNNLIEEVGADHLDNDRASEVSSDSFNASSDELNNETRWPAEASESSTTSLEEYAMKVQHDSKASGADVATKPVVENGGGEDMDVPRVQERSLHLKKRAGALAFLSTLMVVVLLIALIHSQQDKILGALHGCRLLLHLLHRSQVEDNASP